MTETFQPQSHSALWLNAASLSHPLKMAPYDWGGGGGGGGVSDELVDNGRLEIYFGGEWGMVCDETFGFKEVDMVCKQLGFSSARLYSNDPE